MTTKQTQKTFRFIHRNLLSIFILLGLVIGLTPSTSVSAQTCDIQMYQGNDVLFYNPCLETACSTASGSLGGASPKSLSGSSNAEKVWNYFTQRGLSPIAAAGAMGNIDQESSFSPTVVEGGSGIGYGLIQWSFERRTKLESAMNNAGVNKSDNDAALLFQLDYLWDGEYGKMQWQEQVNAETKIEGDTSIASYNSDYSGSLAASQAGNGSTMVFHSLVERSGDSPAQLQERIDSAKTFLDQFSKGGANSECASADGGLTEEQAKLFMMKYGENQNDDSVTAMNAGVGRPGTGCNGGALSNCVSFSAFFVNKFTNAKYQGGNGNTVVDNLAAAGVKTGSEPRLFAVFSNGFNTPAGHTGIILGIEGDKLIVGQASCSHSGTGRGDGTYDGGGAGFVITGTVESGALMYKDGAKFAYPEVDTAAIATYIK